MVDRELTNGIKLSHRRIESIPPYPFIDLCKAIEVVLASDVNEDTEP